MMDMHYKLKPLTQKKAKEFIDEHHRHHKSSRGDVFRIGLTHKETLIGVIQVGRPVSRHLDDGYTLEVNRLCVLNGYKNACSLLYSRAARAGKALGYKRILTYILQFEPGTSLVAAGWSKEHTTRGRDWSCPSRPTVQASLFQKYDKVRYGKSL
tara:strand:+ start:1260 stop:1721 length:462 start_codon:yes stop_codon:yes gene_type:complete